MKIVSVEAFLGDYPLQVQDLAHRARQTVLAAIPDAIERVYPGWRLIGYRVPHGKSSRYFAFVAPYEDEVRLGFEQGIHLEDPSGLLRGDGTQVRYILLRTPSDVTDELQSYIREAAGLSRVPREALHR